MPLSTQVSLLAKRRVMSYANSLKPGVNGTLSWLFQYFAQFKGNPDLQFVPMDTLTNGNTVIADAACKVYAIVLTKATATKSWFKGTDNATTSTTDGSQDLGLAISGADNSMALIFPDGLAMASGLTVCANTTGTGATGSGANGPAGFVLLGNP
jgi:hypothetical protein